MPEFLDIVDEYNNVIGKEERGAAHEKGHIHRSVGILVFRDKTYTELAIQKRGKTLKSAPGKWADVAGHVPAGMTPIDAARMELEEEMFHETRAPKLELEELFTLLKEEDDDPEFRTMFRTVYDGYFSIQPGEVDEWKWIPLAELARDMAAHPGKYSGTFQRVMGRYNNG